MCECAQKTYVQIADVARKKGSHVPDATQQWQRNLIHKTQCGLVQSHDSIKRIVSVKPTFPNWKWTVLYLTSHSSCTNI